MRSNFYILIAFLFLLSFKSFAQKKSLRVKYVENAEIKIDGILDEPAWEQSEMSSEFWEHFPTDKKIAEKQTEVRIFYDDKYLYVSARAYTIGNNYKMISLMRDYDGGANDNINFLFDTFSDRNNAFYFSVSPYGVVRDALLSRGGVDGSKFLDLNWDTTWEAEAKMNDDGYTVELKIPFFAFKFDNEVKSWRFNCYRNDPQSQVNTTWSKIPRNQKIQNLGYMGTLLFDKPLKRSRNPIAVIPYALYNFEKNYTKNTSTSKPDFGADAKIPIGTSMNLDLTVNPDFSNTDVNEGSTNVTRFELHLPEQRQFFLDNSDLFAGFGIDKQTTPFYSRRVGYGKDTTNNDIIVPILAGARLTGKINNNLRIGFLDVQTAKDEDNEIPTNNNLVVAVEQKVFKKSNISAFFINRQAMNAEDYVENKDKYNRVFGADFNYYSKKNRWSGKLYLHKSITPEAGNRDLSSGGFLNYNSRKFTSQTNVRYVGKDFKSDLGFIKRKNHLLFNEKIGPKYYPKSKNINNYGIFFKTSLEYQPTTNKNTDYNYGLLFIMKFRNQSEFRIEPQSRYTYLDKPFDPTKVPGAEPLPVGDYKYSDVFIKYTSDNSKLFSYVASIKTGTYYTGYKTTGELTLRYRIQPLFNTYISATYDYITLPDPHPNATSIVYVGPRVEFTFTKNLYWTTDVQFNSQNENLGIYSRVQWRYRPLSDLFVIYTDSYHTSDYEPQMRAIFVKATFWLNI